MLTLTPTQMAIVDRLARQALSLALARRFASLWPVAADRMGARLADFVDTAVAHAQRHGLHGTPHVSRYVNLWFIWGAAFEDKPGFEWARELLGDPRRGEAVKAHQLARRSQALLRQRGIAGLGSAEFAAADQRLMQAVSGLPGLDTASGALPSAAPPLAECDVATIDIAAIDDAWRGEYRTSPEWTLAPVAASQGAASTRLRIDGEQPARFTLLSRPVAGSGLQVKLRMVSTCDVDHHPRLAWSDGIGTSSWRGHAATSASWPVPANEPVDAATSVACAVAETEPALHRLDVESCGLRDDGLPLGDLHLPVFVYDGRPWLHQWRRAPAATASWPRGDPAASAQPSPPADPRSAFTASRLERDGAVEDDRAWCAPFAELDRAFATSMDGLLQAFERSCGAEHARLDVEAGLLSGDAALAWNWRPDPRGPSAPPFMRLAGRLDLEACALKMDFIGEVSLLGGRARIRLSLQGRAPLTADLVRDAPLPPLAEAMAVAQQRFEFAFALELDPIATPESAALQAGGPVTGRLAGQAGLRPRVDGGSGYQWFVQLRVEAVSAVLKVVDPVLGITLQHCPLLPATTLLDWSTG